MGASLQRNEKLRIWLAKYLKKIRIPGCIFVADDINCFHPEDGKGDGMNETQTGLNTPYDSAFKSIIQKCPRLALFLINEMFFKTRLIDEEYDGTETVELLNRELPSIDEGNLAEDVRLKVTKQTTRVFHMECESTRGGARVMIRFVRYDTRAALDEVEVEDNCIHIRIDDSGVLFLRSTKNTPSQVTVVLHAPQGRSLFYQIPALSIQNYTMDSMLEKELYILLPFLFFNYEKQLERAPGDEVVYEEVKKVFDNLWEKLQELVEKEIITAYEASTLFDCLKAVLEALGNKNEAGQEVGKIMGGRVLKFSADKFFDEGKEEGRREGIEEGRKEGIEEGRKEGIEKGKEQGEGKLSSLMTKMKEAGREEDAFKAAADPVFREQMYLAFDIA